MRRWIAGVCLCFAVTACLAQDDEAAKANALFEEHKRLEALPLYDDLTKAHPAESLYFKRLADCLAAQSAQFTDESAVKAVLTRMRDAARRAVELGDTTEYVRMMANIDPNQPRFAGIGQAARTLFAEGEKAYAAGDYSAAIPRYAAAAEADPKLYEAPLFAGDSAFVQGDLKAAAQWFARAIAIDPDRETAYRYWGDAILKYGKDPQAAKEKFIDAIVAEPYNNLAWQGLTQWAQAEKAVILAPKIDRPAAPVVDPKNPKGLTISITPDSLDEKKHPGGAAWLGYAMDRANYRNSGFKKDFPGEKEYRHTLKEEDHALVAVAQISRELKTKPDKLDESLRNLAELNDAGMLDCWILISGADDGIAQDYDAYRKTHRQLLHDYLERFVVHGGVNLPRNEQKNLAF